MSRQIRLKEFFRKLHHKRWVRGIIYVGWVVGFPIIGFYSYFIEAYRVRHECVKIKLTDNSKKLAKPLHIIQISDLHFGPTNHHPLFLKKCVKIINDLKPDLVALTGDFMQWDSTYARELAEILKDIQSTHGSFAILGNHDYGVCHKNEPPMDPVDPWEVIEAFHAQGIKVLHNESVPLIHANQRLDIIGLGDYWTEHFKPEAAFPKKEVDRQHPVILLSHNPDSIFELQEYDFDLMLSGHVHGGQISFPFIGPLVVPVKNRHLRRGLHKIGHKYLYANRGLGFIFRARLLSIPEITELIIS